MPAKCLQEQYAPESICFGCGPANSQGLHVRSFPEGKQVIADFTPAPYHEAFPGMVNGGIIGAVLDCHANWTAAWALMQQNNEKSPPCTVTAQYSVKLLRPTPSNQTLHLTAEPSDIKADRATISAKLMAGDTVCATCEGLFVAVKPGHPAYHRWGST